MPPSTRRESPQGPKGSKPQPQPPARRQSLPALWGRAWLLLRLAVAWVFYPSRHGWVRIQSCLGATLPEPAVRLGFPNLPFTKVILPSGFTQGMITLESWNLKTLQLGKGTNSSVALQDPYNAYMGPQKLWSLLLVIWKPKLHNLCASWRLGTRPKPAGLFKTVIL